MALRKHSPTPKVYYVNCPLYLFMKDSDYG